MPNRVLLIAAELVRKGWVQCSMSKDAQGLNVPSTHPDAVCWCALGAINRAATGTRDEESGESAVRLLQNQVKSSIMVWNDTPGRTAEQVAKAMEVASYADE